MACTIWHNPRGSKSRQTLALLQEAGQDVTIRRYLEDSPSRAELRAIIDMLRRPVIDLVRTGEATFRQLGLGKDAGDDTLIAAMVDHPILIERPVVICGAKAIIGRPPEAVKQIL